MRSLTILVTIAALALIPVGMGAATDRDNDQASSTVTLELVIANPSADALGTNMQQFIDALRGDLGLTIDSAPSEGISIEPRLSGQGDVDGYVATNHLRFLCQPDLQPEVLSQAIAVAHRFTGADVYMMTAPMYRPATTSWDTQWLQCG
ncbi:MAG TPA: SIMPL domain-containing protein [Nitrolancea sp.]|jgi:hypothetical protein|nr:SIMPL domain-containing protein [Nitrolancea sp.]